MTSSSKCIEIYTVNGKDSFYRKIEKSKDEASKERPCVQMHDSPKL